MLKQTIQLFIKAIVLGILLNVSLQLVPAEPRPPEENTSYEQQPAMDAVIGSLNLLDG